MTGAARSYLFVPGHSKRMLAKAFELGADALVLDFEDGVPAGYKDRARELVQRAIAARHNAGRTRPFCWVRINALADTDWRDDLRAVVQPGIAGIRVPKVHSLETLEELDEALRPCEERAGLRVGSIRLTCNIESAAGLMEARAIAVAPRVSYLAFGAADFAADMGCWVGESGLATLWAQTFLVVSVRAAGATPPIAPPFLRIRDRKGLLRSTQVARALGFFGRSLLHPSQLDVIHRVFSPSGEDITRALDVIRRYEEAVASGVGGAVTAKGEFVGLPTVLQARALLELAKAIDPEKGIL